MCGADASQLGEVVLALFRELEGLSAVVATGVAAFDAGAEWEPDGARSASAWLAARGRLPVGDARRRVRLGRALRTMPGLEAAWLAGDIGEAHAGVLAAARTPATAVCFERDEAVLVSQACGLSSRPFARALAYWRQLADPDAPRPTPRPSVQIGDGSWFLDGQLDPISGAIVSTALRRIREELFAADWADARARVGPGVFGADVPRTPAHRAEGGDGHPGRCGSSGAPAPRPLLSVFVGYETTLAGRMFDGPTA